MVAVALIIATPFFVFFGHLSDKIGRKKIILVGFLIAAFSFLPLFKGLTYYANPALEKAITNSPIVLNYNICDKDCSSTQVVAADDVLHAMAEDFLYF